VLWAPRSKGTDSLAGDIMFFDFVTRRASDLGVFGGLRLSKMPDAAPAGAFNNTVALFACPGSYPSGLYKVSDLRVPVYGPRSREFPDAAPRPLPEDWATSLARVADIVATEARCAPGAGKLHALGYAEAVARSHPGGTRGQLYSIWFK
jgi:hypothetical protein